ncbi:MAG TPA: acyl-CoA dehydrogenase family protein, partial [Oscillospiraceae bacterium]|nr:acyl-CoA dehydrogenase family protein [Oscillospiraceae bacterium]
MAYILDDVGKELVKMAHDFAEKEIKPNVAKWDREGTFPMETYKKAMQMGLHCLEIPEEYGGGGVDYITVAAVMEELGKYDAGF